MNEQFVYLKLVNGEQIMAVKESEDSESVTLKFPMLIKTHLVGMRSNRVSEQVTAGPYSLFADNTNIHINKQHIILDTALAERAIPHYLHLVRDHEGVRLDYTPPQLQWEDEVPADAPDSIDIKEVLDALKSIANIEEEVEAEDKTFVEGNKTLH
jgi:hypothetical protein